MNDPNRLVNGHGLDDILLTVTDNERLAARITAYALGDLGTGEIGAGPSVTALYEVALVGDEGGYRAEFLDLVRRAETAR